MDFSKAREEMVSRQIETRGIKTPRILGAMRKIPRHLFVPENRQANAYEDHPVQIGCGQTISQPYMVALMTDLLAPESRDCVLEIGTGSGYQTAILAALCRSVISIERHRYLADTAQRRLEEMGIDNVAVHCADGTLGWPGSAPYDGILVTAGSPAVPRSLQNQLATGGRLVCPAGKREVQQLLRITRSPAGFKKEESIRCVFVPLIGAEGWNTEQELY